MSSSLYDAAIVGGGPAGLSAALTLGRAGRRVVLFDDGQPRNGPSSHAHGFLTRDGVPPDELRRLGREEVGRYGVEVRATRVVDASQADSAFRLTVGDGPPMEARVLLLATGVVDELPEIEGLVEAWGATVVHCPYCHGHEHRGEPTAVLGRGDDTYNLARLLLGWTDDVVVVTNGPEELDAGQEKRLAREGIRIVRTPIARLRVRDRQLEAIEFEDGAALARRVLYVQPPQRQASPLAERLGAVLTDKGVVEVDEDGRTAVKGLFVIGDAADGPQDLASSVAEGLRAGIAANHDLVVGPPKG
ncbi:MAG TPA: NAD(P)/FAD-dependent oxidoreductase [Rubricoccaceae bacterium]|nr:NAD(P)/FAD-dependent oxidoreductase [Rubricoccaceae bacterium]